MSAYPARKVRHAARRSVIVAGGPDALTFCLRDSGPELFPGVPIVYMYVADDKLAASLGHCQPMFRAFPIMYEFVRTIEQALAWHPQRRAIWWW
jgi:hypothetical protein